MPVSRVQLDRIVEFSPVIVWDALVDDELVSGWLGEARIDPVVGGAFDLAWVGTPEIASTSGRIVEIDRPSRLLVDTAAHGVISFTLTEVPGGHRGTSTRVEVVVDVDLEPRFLPRVRRLWVEALDQLDALLHGHPVDWGIVARGPDVDEADWDVAETPQATTATRLPRATNPNAIGNAP